MSLQPRVDPAALPPIVDELWAKLRAELESQGPGLDLATLHRAFMLSAHAHGSQTRKSGEPYIIHPYEVTRILMQLLDRRADTTLLAATILHDVVEDTPIKLPELARGFGEEAAALVDGVTKISTVKHRTPEAAQAENFRKMLLSMSKDIRVILIKLADRLHNMRTLGSLDADKQQRIARETLDVYAPLAHRLGIGQIKWELEDLSFKYLESAKYQALKEAFHSTRAERQDKIDEVRTPLTEGLAANGVKAEVLGRPKHFYSVQKKLDEQGRDLDDVYDLLGVRVITDSKADCYRALGVVHDVFTPVPDRFKDYIATPKSNMYQSLHTTVVGPRGENVEVQIRTREMHRTAELGIAAHYSYKEGTRADRELQNKLGGFVAETTGWHSDTTDPDDFLEFLKTSLYQDEVFVFTPKGDLKQLPKGSTPLDLAYLIHTDVGHRTVGAKVEGHIVPLRYQLKSGEKVEIITQRDARPRPEWLRLVRSSHAKGKIRRWLKQEQMAEAVGLGRDMLDRELRKRHVKLPSERDLGDVAQALGYVDATTLLAAIGKGNVSAGQISDKLHPPAEPAPVTGKKTQAPPPRADGGIRIQNVSNLLLSFAKCCQPVPGDQVIGIVTRGRGVSVHRIDCPNTFPDRVEADRKLPVEWDVAPTASFYVKLVVYGRDRKSLLADIAAAIAKTATNIKNVEMGGGDAGGEARGEFVVGVTNLAHLERVIREVESVTGVTVVDRQQMFPAGRNTDGHARRR